MKHMMQKTGAALLAAALLCGSVPGVPDSRTVITAGAEETAATELIAVGNRYYIGDTIDFGPDEVLFIWEESGVYDSMPAHGTYVFSFGIDPDSGEETYWNEDYGQYQVLMSRDDDPNALFFAIEDRGWPEGIEVTGGDGSEEDPYTFGLFFDEPAESEVIPLSTGEYSQFADQGGYHYVRYVAVRPKSELEGKSEALFTVMDTKDRRVFTYPTNVYYTRMVSAGEVYAPESADSVMFIVTIASGDENIEDRLSCEFTME